MMIYGPIGNICARIPHTLTPMHTFPVRLLSCFFMCYPWLQGGLEGSEKSAMLNPLGRHVHHCMTRPYVASLRVLRRACKGRMASTAKKGPFISCICTDISSLLLYGGRNTIKHSKSDKELVLFIQHVSKVEHKP